MVIVIYFVLNIQENQDQVAYVKDNNLRVLYSVSHVLHGTTQNVKDCLHHASLRDINVSNAEIGKV